RSTIKMMKHERVASATRLDMRKRLSWLAIVITLALPLYARRQANPPQQTAPSASSADQELAGKFAKVKRIYVESFGDDLLSKQAQAMVIDALTKTHRFIVTEKKDNADAVLKGAGLEKTSQELHATSEATSVGGAAGSHSGSVSGNNGSISGSSSGGFVARSGGNADFPTSSRTGNDARGG